jgi:protein-S-isoprenylcysteine O-methyltransferase Ste14
MDRLFDAFQLVALASFLIAFGGRSLALWLTRGVKVFALAGGKPPLQAALELSLVVGLPLWLYEIAAYALPLSVHVFPPPLDRVLADAVAVKLLGALLVTAGLVIFALALDAFGDSWRVGIDRRAPGALVTDGIFAHSRNPIFLFMNLYFLGTFLLNGRLIFLVAALLAAAGIHYQILQEERFLEAIHGDSYRRYRARVARYLFL